MEPVVKEKYFIVIRGKSKKGFCRGGIGRVEGELQNGELMAVVYCGSSNNGTPKTGGIVKKEDTYPLTRHQAQLLLFISSTSKRLELLCNPQLFSAICELSHEDLVVVKHKKGHVPGLVKNLMQIGRNDCQEDLSMLGFEVEILDTDHNRTQTTIGHKKSVPPPLYSAADIVQVVPSHAVPLGVQWKEGSGGQSLTRQPGGALEGKTGEWAGVELDYDVKGCSDGTYGGKRFFTCNGNKALFIPKTKCHPDSRFGFCGESVGSQIQKAQVPPFEESEDHVPPLTESEALSVLVGKMKGIQGNTNSCYLDATIFSLFCSSLVLDRLFQKPLIDIEPPTTCTLRKIINRLRRQGFVPAESVMNFRKQLGCDTFSTEEKDPEEFITVLFQKVLCIEPLLKLRSSGERYQDTYTLQIFLEKEQMGPMPTVQQLLDTSCLSSDLKFEVVPSCLMIQMPRFGSKYKMFSQIIPSVELNITDLLHNCPRECFLCGCLAEFECLQCLPDRKLHPGRIKQFCVTCNKQTSHYVSFVKCGTDPKSWIFFDSMADRCGNDQSGYNIPEVCACPEVGDFLSQSEEELACTNLSQVPELVRRMLCDSYMLLYQNPVTPLTLSDSQQQL
ncbi:hypothetical protein WMY93_016079 [Mugilogobius chulae]|uniref:ubiquitinyl hydrolase 1 n=1 Tax=Mugilogobius chulae TaxID=88201 RepID=A0AAW0NSW3_9GOBI